MLISWLFIAPVASNLVSNPGANPFFKTTLVQEERASTATYIDFNTTITLPELLDPTRLLLSGFLLIFILELCLGRNRLFPLDRTEIWMTLFALMLLCSALQSQRVAFGLRTALDAFIVPFIGYFLGRRLVVGERELHKLIQVISYMGCYIIVLVVVEYVVNRMGFSRVHGPFQSTDLLYIVMSTVFFMSMLERGGTEKHLPRLPWGIRQVVTYLAPVTIFLTWSRGNWLGFFSALIVFIFLVRRWIGLGRKLAATAAATLIIAITITIIPLLSMKDLFGERITSPGNAYGRLSTWQVGLEGAMQHPILGLGLNDSRIFLAQHQIRMGDINSYSTLHNSLLSIFVELGVIGLLTYLAIIASILRMGLNVYAQAQHVSDRWRGAALIALMVAQQIAPLFSLGLYIPHMAQVYLYVCLGAIAGLYSRHRLVPHLSSFRADVGAWRQGCWLKHARSNQHGD